MRQPSIRRRALAALVACVAIAGTAPAEAVVTYQLQDVTTTTTRPEFPLAPRPFSFTVSDAAVARGDTGVIRRNWYLGSLFDAQGPTGDVSDLLGVNLLTQGVNPSPLAREGYVFQASFAPDRSVTGFTFGFVSDFALYDTGMRSVDGNLVRGGYASEGPACGNSFSPSSICTLTGRLEIAGVPVAAVPEPASMTLLGVGLLGLAAVSGRTKLRSGRNSLG